MEPAAVGYTYALPRLATRKPPWGILIAVLLIYNRHADKMLLARLHQLPWQLIGLLLATPASAAISASNTSTLRPDLGRNTLPLAHADANGRKIADVIPLTQEAVNSVRRDHSVASECLN